MPARIDNAMNNTKQKKTQTQPLRLSAAKNGKGTEREPERIEFARQQRQQANDFSKGVWEMLRGRRMQGQKFRREHPFGPYTLDFVCLDLRLNIEVDGKHHFTTEGRQHDEQRDRYLLEQGFQVMRIDGFQVTQDACGVRRKIQEMVVKLQAEILNGAPSNLPPHPGTGEPG